MELTLFTQALIAAEQAHAKYEQDALGGKRDENWQEWYAHYMLQWFRDQSYDIKIRMAC